MTSTCTRSTSRFSPRTTSNQWNDAGSGHRGPVPDVIDLPPGQREESERTFSGGSVTHGLPWGRHWNLRLSLPHPQS